MIETSPPIIKQRYIFIDNLRASIFILLAFDHVIHAYAAYYGRFHFFKDFDRSVICDVLYLFDNSIIMPLLFFITGLFVLPAVQHKGLWPYIKNRFFKLVVPYVIGIPFIVPLLVYPRYCYIENPACHFIDFWRDIYFAEKLQGGGPFWVLFCWALYSSILIAVVTIIPYTKVVIHKLMHMMLRRAVASITLFILLSMVILTLSDFRWGAPWWIGMEPFATYGYPIMIFINKILSLFHLQASRFIIHALYFLLGAIISLMDEPARQQLWSKLAQRWLLWLVGMIVIGVIYIGFTINYANNGAYSFEIYRYFKHGGQWTHVLPVVEQYGWAITIRTCLHGAFIFFQVATLLSLFYRRYNQTQPLWCSLTNCAYGIFLLHEVPVIWLQYQFSDMNLPIIIKIMIIFSIGVGGTWLLVSKLRQIPGAKKII